MILEKIANKKVITVPLNASMLEAAKAMRDHHVGSVIVIEEKANVPSRSCWFAGGFTPFLTGLASCACQPLQ